MRAVLTGFADPALLSWIGLPGADRLLDPDRLSATVGRAVLPHRLRVKPGRSLLVGWRSADEGPEGYGWAAALTDRDKVAGVLRRAHRSRAAVSVHRPGPDVTVLVGDLASEPELARELAAARRRLPAASRTRVLAHNPGRRVLLRVEPCPAAPDTGRVVRIGAGRQDHLVDLAHRWRGFGGPTLPVTPLGRRGTAVVSPWWGRGDLHRLPDVRVAHRAGRAVAGLHRASAGQVGTAAPVLGPVHATGAMLAELLPAWQPRLARMITVLTERLGDPGAASLVHGDLSPDQVLWDGHNPGRLRVIDLDRAGPGPAGLDVGSWTAACAVTGQPELASAFLAGYSERLPVHDAASWHARALLAAALEPFRGVDPDWRHAVGVRLRLAEAALDLGGAP